MEKQSSHFKFGVSKRRRLPAMRIALPIGVVIALMAGFAKVLLFNPPEPLRWLSGLVLGICLCPCFIMLVWLCIVDRNSLPGATPRADISIETTWYNTAASNAFNFTMAGCGIALFIISGFFDHKVFTAVELTLSSILFFGIIVFSISYAFHRYQDTK